MKEDHKNLIKDLIERGLYKPGSPFHNTPEITKSSNAKYQYEISCYKWNTKSSKFSVYNARYDKTKGKYIFSQTKKGSPRIINQD